jgi:hypothetical protein
MPQNAVAIPQDATIGQPPPGAVPIPQDATVDQPQQDSFWRQVYDRSSIGALQKLTGQLSDWAKQKSAAAQTADEANVAQGGKPKSMASEVFSSRGGYDLLAHTSGLVSSLLEPKSAAITAGVAAANTNPFTGIPVDAALVAHGGYGMAKNAPAALKGDPDAVQNFFLSGAEAAGGAAGQVRAFRAPVRAPAAAASAGPTGSATPEQAAATGAAPSRAVAPGAAEAPAQTAGMPTQIARTLGISDPPPNQLLTKAIKPIASNTGWDAAIAKAAPDMKAVEADLGRPISGVDDALEAVSLAKKGIWNQYAAKLQAAKEAFPDAPSMSTIDGNEVADAMMNSIDKRTQLQRPDLVERIQKVADTYRRPMGLDEAEDFLQSTNNDLHNYYAKNKVGRQVAQGDPEMGSTVAEGDQLRDSLYSTLDNLTGPGAADLKQRYGALSNVENELLRRKNVAARQQPDSLAEQLGMARAYGKIAVGVARLSPSSLLEGTQSLAAAKWLKTRGTTDAMISRAFQALGTQATPAAPQGPSPTAPAATGAAAGTAAPDETPDNSTGPISQNQESSAPENNGAALLQKHGAMNVRQALNNPVTQDILQSVAPNTAAFLLKRAGIADKTSFRNRGRANG